MRCPDLSRCRRLSRPFLSAPFSSSVVVRAARQIMLSASLAVLLTAILANSEKKPRDSASRAANGTSGNLVLPRKIKVRAGSPGRVCVWRRRAAKRAPGQGRIRRDAA